VNACLRRSSCHMMLKITREVDFPKQQKTFCKEARKQIKHQMAVVEFQTVCKPVKANSAEIINLVTQNSTLLMYRFFLFL